MFFGCYKYAILRVEMTVVKVYAIKNTQNIILSAILLTLIQDTDGHSQAAIVKFSLFPTAGVPQKHLSQALVRRPIQEGTGLMAASRWNTCTIQMVRNT